METREYYPELVEYQERAIDIDHEFVSHGCGRGNETQPRGCPRGVTIRPSQARIGASPKRLRPATLHSVTASLRVV